MAIVDIERFVADGFVKLEAAVPRTVGDAARRLLWQQIGLSPDRLDGWTRPVVWAADHTGQGPFGQIVKSEPLAAALDVICGPRGWLPRGTVGNIPIRFPGVPPADDQGWHIDLNTLDDGTWSVSGRSQTMLLLTLFSDVGPDDAPTRIRVGSQRDSATVLDENPLDHTTASQKVAQASEGRPVAYATGQPGDVYLVHPLTVHAANMHRGTEPRFMAQAPIVLAQPLTPSDDTPLARAVRW